MLLPQMLPTHVSEVSLSSCVLSGFSPSSNGWGSSGFPQFGMFSLLIREKVKHYKHFGNLFCCSATCSYTSVKPFGLSSSGSPLVHSFYAAKRSKRTIAHVISLGPYGAHIFSPRDWGGGDTQVTNAITLEVTRVVLAVGVFAIGVELPSKYMKKHARSLVFLWALPLQSSCIHIFR